jgi:hypothetical protein
MDEGWLTYREAADILHVSPQAVRQKAIRGRWLKISGNDGKARVQVPDTVSAAVSATMSADSDETGKHHVRQRVRHRVREADVSLVAALEGHVQTLQAELASEKERVTATEAQLSQRDAQLAEANMRADKVIAAFASLADRLDALVEARRRSWWPWRRAG